jgi:prepilin-type N-terminal cleavage/methylation domain-containing protein
VWQVIQTVVIMVLQVLIRVRKVNKEAMNKKQGFTLIELLVVIAIIAVLVAFSVANFVGARSRALDIKKKSELLQVKNALRLYYNDYQTYPGPATTATNTFNGCGSPSIDCGDGAIFTDGTTVYMKQLPPSTSYTWQYQQVPASDDFCLWTTLNNQSDTDIIGSQARCSGCSVGSADYVLCAD